LLAQSVLREQPHTPPVTVGRHVGPRLEVVQSSQAPPAPPQAVLLMPCVHMPP
jgi:hypothetical protein